MCECSLRNGDGAGAGDGDVLMKSQIDADRRI